MRIHVVNPNTTASMTAKIAAAARRAAALGTEIIAATSADGPSSIEGFFDGALSLAGLLEQVRKAEAMRVGAHIIACFDDTGLDAARSLAVAPIVGIGEAAYHVASLVARRFSVVTTLANSIPVLEENLTRYGLTARCVAVRAAGVPVLALEAGDGAAYARISDEIAESIREDGAEAVVLGCAGMADLAAALSDRHGVPVVEGVSAAVKLAESLAALGLATSKVGAWAPPPAKTYVGRLAFFGEGA